MLRRYGVTRDPRLALRALACEGAICAGQLLRDRTAAGPARAPARLARGRRPRAPRRRTPPPSSTSAPARRWRCAGAAAGLARAGAEPARGREAEVAARGAGGGARAEAAAAGAGLRACRAGSPASGAGAAARASAPASTAAIRGSAAAGMNLAWVASRLRATSRAFQAPGPRRPRQPGGVAEVPDDRLRHVGEAPAGDPRPHVEVDVLVEGEVALVVAAELGRRARAAAGRRRRRRRRPRAVRAAALACASPAPISNARPSPVSAWPAL